MLQTYPNPFVGVLRFDVTLPALGNARIELFDLLGRRVMVALNEPLSSGQHSSEVHPGSLSPGAYYRV